MNEPETRKNRPAGYISIASAIQSSRKSGVSFKMSTPVKQSTTQQQTSFLSTSSSATNPLTIQMESNPFSASQISNPVSPISDVHLSHIITPPITPAPEFLSGRRTAPTPQTVFLDIKQLNRSSFQETKLHFEEEIHQVPEGNNNVQQNTANTTTIPAPAATQPTQVDDDITLLYDPSSPPPKMATTTTSTPATSTTTAKTNNWTLQTLLNTILLQSLTWWEKILLIGIVGSIMYIHLMADNISLDGVYEMITYYSKESWDLVSNPLLYQQLFSTLWDQITTYLTSLDPIRVIVMLLWGILLSISLDTDLNITDRRVMSMFRTFQHTCITTGQTFYDSWTIFHSLYHTFSRCITYIVSSYQQIPLFFRYLFTSLVVYLLLYITIPILYHTYTPILQSTLQMTMISIMTYTLPFFLLYVCYQIIVYLLYRQALRKQVIHDLIILVKIMLLQKQDHYPISYLYADIEDFIAYSQQQQLKKQQKEVKPIGTNNSKKERKEEKKEVKNGWFSGWWWRKRSSPTSSEAPVTSVVAVTAEEESKKEALYTSPLPISLPMQQDVSLQQIRLYMHGFALASLWSEVQKSIQQDQRIQSVTIAIQGKPEKCWKYLPADTTRPWYAFWK